MKKVFIGFLVIIFTAIIGFLVWTQFGYSADPEYLGTMLSSSGRTIINTDKTITITPQGSIPSYTIIFYPGAKVDPQAYIYKLGTIARTYNLRIIIDKPLFDLQIFGINNADAISGANLIIAGHSLGGAMACEYVSSHPGKFVGMILMGAYCNSDISTQSGINVLSFAASNDGLISVEKMQSFDNNLPAQHNLVVITGATHAQYGNYGLQDGDGTSTTDDDQVLQQLSDAIGEFIELIIKE